METLTTLVKQNSEKIHVEVTFKSLRYKCVKESYLVGRLVNSSRNYLPVWNLIVHKPTHKVLSLGAILRLFIIVHKNAPTL